MDNKTDIILRMIKNEFTKATYKFGSFNSAHEGYAILLEEVDELWNSIKLNQKVKNRNDKILEESIHVAAMAVRLIHDIIKLQRIKKYNHEEYIRETEVSSTNDI